MDLTLEQEKESQKTQYQMLEAQNFFTIVDHVTFYSIFLTIYMIVTIFTVNDYSQ